MSRISTAAEVIRTRGSNGPWYARAARAPMRLVLWLALRLLMRIEVEGDRATGPAVIASNHPNLVDGLLALMADAQMRPIARWHRIALVRLGLWIGNSLITTTGTPVRPHRGAYAGALAHLRNGGRVWVAPEGGCQPEPTLRPPRTGAVRLAHAAAVPIQVLALVHEAHPGPDVRRWPLGRRPRVVLRWGPCISATGHIPTDIHRMMAAMAATAGMRWSQPATGATATPSTSV
jgi:1-acyl-sn-glycerol-3-phosphate acyltransferase